MLVFRVAMLLLFVTGGVAATQKPIAATDAWIKLSGDRAQTAPAFAVVDNPTMYDVYLVGASSDVAEQVEFRDKDKEVREVTAPAYGKVELTASGVHMVLTGLKRPLKVGETIAITFTTDSGVTLTAQALVKP